MANVQFSVPIDAYCGLIKSLSDGGEFASVIDELRASANITNSTDEEPYIVHVKIDSTNLGNVLQHLLAKKVVVRTSEADALIEAFKARLEEQRIAAEKQSQYEKWLRSCFDKYVIDSVSPTCKELAVLINNNELGEFQPKVKYQSIMKYLKDYRREKFGDK